MKLGVIGPVPPWRGGVAQHTSQLIISLKASSHRVLGISFAEMYPIWLYPGQTAARPASGQSDTSVANFLVRGTVPSTWKEAVDSVTAFDADVVVIPWWTVYWAPFCVYTTRRLKRHGIPTLFFCHNISDHDSTWWKSSIAKLTLAQGAGYVTHTQEIRRQLIRWLPSVSVAVYPHPLYEQFPKPEEIPTRRAGLELLFFGYVRRYKGLDLLVEALGSLRTLDFHLRIAGEFWLDPGPLETRMIQLGIRDRITIVPRYVDDLEAAGFMTLADAVVLPYREASGSGVAALALSYDTPVVATRVGGLAESVVEGETGILVDPNDPKELARGIADLLEPRDWTARIARHKKSASWGGLAATVEQSVRALLAVSAASADPPRRTPRA